MICYFMVGIGISSVQYQTAYLSVRYAFQMRQKFAKSDLFGSPIATAMYIMDILSETACLYSVIRQEMNTNVHNP